MNIVILGGGATGLTTAYLLRQSGHRITVLEGASQPGGLLSTFDVGGGHRLEYFYHHFFTHDAEINWLLAELGIADQVSFLPTSMGITRGGRHYPFNGIKDLLKFQAIGLMGRLRFGFSSALLAYLPGYANAETTNSMKWFSRWAGSSATDAIWRPMLGIKFGEAAERIPLAWMAGRLRQRVRSRKKGVEKLGYLQGSLQVLVDRLVQQLQTDGVDLRLNTRCERLLLQDGKAVGVSTTQGNVPADLVVSTLPTTNLVPLVKPHASEYADQLSRIKYMGAMCVVLSLKEQLSPVYWLNVADPGYDFGGVIEQTNFIPPERYGGQHLVYLSRYLHENNPLWSMPEDELIARQLDQLERLFGRPVKPLVNKHWVFRGRHAAPVTEMGFHELIPSFKTPIPGLFLASMCHIYPDERSVNNSIRVSAELLRAMGFGTLADRVPRGLSLSAKYGGANPATQSVATQS
jgi:protoporphyrinogen oxidase